MDSLPSISIIIVGRNCAKSIPECLKPILDQNYPSKLIEILFIDGESSDNSREVAQSHGATVIHGGYPQNAEARRGVGTKSAKHDILAFIDVDNIIPHKNWLRDMAQPFIDHPELVGAFTKWYGLNRDISRMEQYYALVGGNDPISFYLGKNDRVPYLEKSLPKGAHLIAEQSEYEVVSFNLHYLPAIGCNGFLLRRKMIEQLNYTNYNNYLHVDVNVDIIKKLKKNQFAIVKTTILHLTGNKIYKNLIKRINYMNIHHVGLKKERRYQVFDAKKSQDIFKLVLCVLYAVTFIEPLWRSYRGWLRTGNINWFLHPMVTFLFTVVYGFNICSKVIKR